MTIPEDMTRLERELLRTFHELGGDPMAQRVGIGRPRHPEWDRLEQWGFVCLQPSFNPELDADALLTESGRQVAEAIRSEPRRRAT